MIPALDLPRAAEAPRYHPYFCEENIWWLSGDPALRDREPQVAFVSNAGRCVAMCCQRSGDADAGWTLWDYHVLLFARSVDGIWEAWDLDSTLGAPVPALWYLERTFPAASPAAPVDPRLLPSFRLVPAHEYRVQLHSDRSHMVEHGLWRAPPPPWPPILGASPSLLALAGLAGLAGLEAEELADRDPAGKHNLDRYIDMHSSAPGELLDLGELRRRLAAQG